MNNKKGFTLIELIIVFSIMSIIAAIAVPKFSNIIDSQEEKTCIENRKIIMEHYNFQKFIDEDITLEEFLADSEDYFNEEVSCPSDGEYTVSNGAIICNEHGRLPENEDDDANQGEDDEDDENVDGSNYQWSSSENYKKDDVVIHNELCYLAHNNEVNDEEPGTEGSHWIEITIVDWPFNDSYGTGAVVKYENLLYRAQGNPQNEEPGSSNKWIKIGENINNMDDFLDLLN